MKILRFTPPQHAQCTSKRMSIAASTAAVVIVRTLGCGFRRKAFSGGV